MTQTTAPARSARPVTKNATTAPPENGAVKHSENTTNTDVSQRQTIQCADRAMTAPAQWCDRAAAIRERRGHGAVTSQ